MITIGKPAMVKNSAFEKQKAAGSVLDNAGRSPGQMAEASLATRRTTLQADKGPESRLSLRRKSRKLRVRAAKAETYFPPVPELPIPERLVLEQFQHSFTHAAADAVKPDGAA